MEGSSDTSGSAGRRTPRTKGQKRLDRILEQIPVAREQLLAAIEDLGAEFSVETIRDAMRSEDPRERNKVAVIERELDVLIAYLEELASRGLAEGQRIGVVAKSGGTPFERLARLDVISAARAGRLLNVKEMRNELAHAYPPASWRALHQAASDLLRDLNGYVVKVSDWLSEQEILP